MPLAGCNSDDRYGLLFDDLEAPFSAGGADDLLADAADRSIAALRQQDGR
jgi:hypothetical protein